MRSHVVKSIERVVEDRNLVGKPKEQINKESNLLYLVVKDKVFLITKNIIKYEIKEDAEVVCATVTEEDGKVVSVNLYGRASDPDRFLNPIGIKVVRARVELVC